MDSQASNPDHARANAFASILASLAQAKPVAPKSAPVSWEDQLAEDVATLSYEQALKTHGRYRAPVDDAIFNLPDPPIPAPQSVAQTQVQAAPVEVAPAPDSAIFAHRTDLKCASITIRLSHAESEQLRQRAAAAGMTVSAYLRSCTLEAESLRQMVRQTMSELKAAALEKERLRLSALPPKRRSWFGWLRTLLGGHKTPVEAEPTAA